MDNRYLLTFDTLDPEAVYKYEHHAVCYINNVRFKLATMIDMDDILHHVATMSKETTDDGAIVISAIQYMKKQIEYNNGGTRIDVSSLAYYGEYINEYLEWFRQVRSMYPNIDYAEKLSNNISFFK